MTSILVTDPILRVRTVTGTAHVGLHELLHLAHTGSLFDLPGVRADQRASVVTALAVISHLVKRYSPSVPATADDWRDALAAQFGDCLTLVNGLDNKPQFFQPVIDMTLADPFTITEMDHLMPAMRHALSRSDKAPSNHLFGGGPTTQGTGQSNRISSAHRLAGWAHLTFASARASSQRCVSVLV
jgi:hypothetical protein